MPEPFFQPKPMTRAERREFCRKAEADALAWQSAQLLSQGTQVEAAKLALTAIRLRGPELFAFWLEHYATNKFGCSLSSVRKFLAGILPEARAA